MANTRKLIEQIIEVRERRGSEPANAELFRRVLDLQISYERRPKDNPELLRHYPVALVACMEAFFRLAIKQLIDADQRYLRNAANLASRVKLDFDLVKALHGKEISLGDLLAHAASINNLTDIAAHMSALLDTAYLDAVAKTFDRWAVEVEKKKKEPIIDNPDKVYRSVARTFELRHIFCHEFATAYKLEAGEIETCFESSITFLKAAEEHLSDVLHPGAPLTQTDMNIGAGEELKKETARLEACDAELLKKPSQ